MAIMIPEPHYIKEEADFISFVNQMKKGDSLDRVSKNAGLSRHALKSAFSKGSGGKLSSVLSVCDSMGYDIIIARRRED